MHHSLALFPGPTQLFEQLHGYSSALRSRKLHTCSECLGKVKTEIGMSGGGASTLLHIL